MLLSFLLLQKVHQQSSENLEILTKVNLLQIAGLVCLHRSNKWFSHYISLVIPWGNNSLRNDCKRNCEHQGMLLQLVGVRFFLGQFFLYDRSPGKKTDMSSFRVFFFFVTFYTFFTYFITLNKPPLQIP